MQPVDINGHGDPEFAALSEHAHSMQLESLTATIKRYQPTLYRVAFRMLRNAQDAEGAVQDALLLAFRNLSQFKGEAKMTTTWLIAMVVNSARAVIQRHYSRRQTVSLHQMEDEEVRAGRICSLTAGRVLKGSMAGPNFGASCGTPRNDFLRACATRFSSWSCRAGLSIQETALMLGVSIG